MSARPAPQASASLLPRGTPFSWLLPAALVAALGCPHPQPGAEAAPEGPEPELRVGLAMGLSSVRLGGDGELFITDDGNGQPVGAIAAGSVWTIAVDSAAGFTLLRPDGTRTERHQGISAVNVTEGRFAMANGRRYRGRINVVRLPGGLLLINRLPLESYLAGVLGQEMGPRRQEEREALLAQAIIARTFAVRNRGRWEANGFDATADTRDQVYTGVDGETAQVWDALRATTGQVVRFQGKVIDAYYHASCGGRTAAVEDVFKSARRQPYLRSVSDASGGGHSYCELAPHFQWREEWDAQTLRTILTRTLPAVMTVSGDGLQPIADVQVTRTTSSGRVGELRIVFAHGDVRIAGPDVRTILRPAADRLLQSAAFRVSVTTDGGRVSRLVAQGSGAGHGVGFCQWGAIGRARAGQQYREILTTYFPGTTVERLY
ncbi:MAG TPA: SpoIID/LytB domain-containing protein [Gemmatimonadales bacterium]|nr:SpoIID/LytB domain-containing protein [Gemmatimonadales bacterium]